MSSATETLIEYLREAEATEQESLSLLEGHVRGAPPGPYRSAVRRHLDETRRHAHQVGERLTDLGASRNPFSAAVNLGEAVVGRALGLALAPVNLLAGRTSPDQLLRDAQDEIAAEAREVAVYVALERLAEAAGDQATASLARTIRGDEERQLRTLRELLEGLADRVARRRLGGAPPEATPVAAEQPAEEERTAPDAATSAPTNGGPVHTERETPYRDRAERLREARRQAAPSPEGPTRAEAARVREREREAEQDDVVETEGAAAPGANLRVEAPWEGYDSMKAGDIVARLRESDPATRAMVRLYEQSKKGRKSILAATEA
jgi:ferritin-like metal-binding protein YciE